MTTLCVNRRARFDYTIVSTFEAGIVLLGTEVQALRKGRGQITESFANFQGSQLILRNAFIGAYAHAASSHEERRSRVLLCHKREIRRLRGQIEQKGYTLVPLSLYTNARGKIKIEMGCVTGKKSYEKRATLKKRDWQREKERVFRRTSV